MRWRESVAASEPVATRTQLPPVDPRLDSFVQNVMGDASARTGYTYKFGEGSRTPEQQAVKVAGGFSKTYNSKHLSGRGRDVLAFDPSGAYITDGSHEAYKALGDVYREKSASAGLPIRWGGDFHDFYDPGHFELDDDGEESPAPALKLDGVLEPTLDLQGIVEPPNDEEIVSINARKPAAPPPPEPRTLSPLDERKTFNAQTEEGRQRRDARDFVEWGSNSKLTLDVPLPAGASDWSQVSSEQASRQAAHSFAASRNIPADFVEKWLDKNKHLDLHLYDSKTNERRQPADYIYEGSPAYDFERRTLRVSADMPHLKQLEQDYQASKGVMDGLSDLANDDTHSPFEKLNAATWDSPQGRETRGAVDVGMKTVSASDRYGWARALGYGDAQASAWAAMGFEGLPTPVDNPAGDAWRAGVEASTPYVGPAVSQATGSR